MTRDAFHSRGHDLVRRVDKEAGLSIRGTPPQQIRGVEVGEDPLCDGSDGGDRKYAQEAGNLYDDEQLSLSTRDHGHGGHGDHGEGEVGLACYAVHFPHLCFLQV